MQYFPSLLHAHDQSLSSHPGDPEANLTKVTHYLDGSYTNYVNRRKRRNGHLFQGRYKAILIDRDNYLLELSRYVHLNPVRAKMVPKESRYRRKRYRSLVESGTEVPLDDPLKKTYGGAVLGGKKFIKDVLERVKTSVIEDREISNRKELQSAYALDRCEDQ